MAWAEELPDGTYRAVWRDAAGRKRSTKWASEGRPFTFKTAALRYANQQDGKAKAPRASGPTWGEWREEWEQLRLVESSTELRDRSRIDAHLEPRWGRVRLGKIDRVEVQKWMNELRRAHSPGTALRIYATFAASMRAAVKYGKLEANPCHDIDKPAAAPSVERYLTRAEFDAILAFMPEPYRTFAILAAATGARFGELAGLHWERVDLAAPAVTFAETWPTGATEVKAYPKTKKAVTVPLAGWAVEALVTLTPANPRAKCGNPHAKGSTCRSPLVFTTEAGTPLDANNVRKRYWAPACERAGVGHVRMHDLRHSFASWLREGNVDIQTVQELMGHAEIRTTSRYSHIGQHAKTQRVLEALER